MDDKALKKLRDIIVVEIKRALIPISNQQNLTNHKLDMLYQRTEKIEETQQEHTEKLDATLVDIHTLQDDVKGLWSDTTEIKQKFDRRVKQMREELGLPSSQ